MTIDQIVAVVVVYARYFRPRILAKALCLATDTPKGAAAAWILQSLASGIVFGMSCASNLTCNRPINGNFINYVRSAAWPS